MYKLNDELAEIVQRHENAKNDSIDAEIALAQGQLERVLRDTPDSSESMRKTQSILMALIKAKIASRKFKLESGRLVPIEAVMYMANKITAALGEVIKRNATEEGVLQMRR